MIYDLPVQEVKTKEKILRALEASQHNIGVIGLGGGGKNLNFGGGKNREKVGGG